MLVDRRNGVVVRASASQLVYLGLVDDSQQNTLKYGIHSVYFIGATSAGLVEYNSVTLLKLDLEYRKTKTKLTR